MAAPEIPKLEMFVGKVDVNATAEELALFFRNSKDVPVVKCQTMQKGGSGQHKGFAFITLATFRDYKELLQRVEGNDEDYDEYEFLPWLDIDPGEVFNFEGRSLSIGSSKGASGSAPKDPEKIFSFEGSLLLGVLHGQDTFLTKWSVSESSSTIKVKMVVNFQARYVRFSYSLSQYSSSIKRYIQYHTNDVNEITCISLDRSDGPAKRSPAILFRTKSAPKLFENSSLGYAANRFLWEIVSTDDTGPNSKRVLDFSPDQAISTYRDLLFIPTAALRRRFEEEANLAGYDNISMRDPIYLTERPLTPQPIVKLPESVSYKVRFQMESLYSHAILCKELLPVIFFQILCQMPEKATLAAIDELRDFALNAPASDEEEYVNNYPLTDPLKKLKSTKAFRNFKMLKPVESKPDLASISAIEVHRVIISPLTTHCWGLESETPNRVLRQYRHLLEYFLRVSFTEEDYNQLIFRDGESTSAITDRFRKVLREGLAVGDRKFDFLGMSCSQMREHSCWFFSDTLDPKTQQMVTADAIRSALGNFEEVKVVAKYAARLGQCFSSTISSDKCKLVKEQFEEIPDKEQGQHNFTDGIGKLSPKLAKTISKSTNQGGKGTPSAFQIRFAGYKGVVAVDPTLDGKVLMQLRPSMRKFKSPHYQIEVCNTSFFSPAYLNRQIILLLSSLGVKNDVFVEKQGKMLASLKLMLEDPEVSIKYITSTSSLHPNSAILAAVEMMEAGFDVKKEPFVQSIVQSYRKLQIDDLRKKARIFVEDAACLMGVIDETDSLEYGQIFVQLREKSKLITGIVAVTKNPCFHPGDIRKLEAVDKPNLHHLFDVVVFPAKGPRPHTDEISGSDLDGDLYFVTWDKALIPSKRNRSPMDYTPPALKTKEDIDIEDVKDFYIDYIKNYQLGQIANSHLAHADYSPMGADDPKCITLAEMHSLAVDFPKTGVVPKMEKHLRPEAYPDFMQKFDKISYPSIGVLGDLFQKIKVGVEEIRRWQMLPVVQDKDLIYRGYEAFVDSASSLKDNYNAELRVLMDSYDIPVEATALTGNLTRLGRIARTTRIGEVRLQIRKKMREFFRKYRTEFHKDVEKDSEKALAKSSALYYVTYKKRSKEKRLISCPWIVHDYLCQIKRQAVSKTPEHSKKPASKRNNDVWKF